MASLPLVGLIRSHDSINVVILTDSRIGPTIISGFGFDTNQSTLLNMGSGGAQVAGTVLALFIAKRTNRTVGGIWTLALAIIGVIMMLAIPQANYGARYGGYILMMQCERGVAAAQCCLGSS